MSIVVHFLSFPFHVHLFVYLKITTFRAPFDDLCTRSHPNSSNNGTLVKNIIEGTMGNKS